MEAYPQSFYLEDPVQLAQSLLGSLIVRSVSPNDIRIARIVETEAYRGTDDKACHASKGRTERTARTENKEHRHRGYVHNYDSMSLSEWGKVATAPLVKRSSNAVKPQHYETCSVVASSCCYRCRVDEVQSARAGIPIRCPRPSGLRGTMFRPFGSKPRSRFTGHAPP